jgi:hypothetical protein
MTKKWKEKINQRFAKLSPSNRRKEKSMGEFVNKSIKN